MRWLLALVLVACGSSSEAPPQATGSGMKIDIGQLPDDWGAPAKVAVASWRTSLDKLHAQLVEVTPVRGSAGGTAPYLMQLRATDATGKVVFETPALIAERQVLNRLPAKAAPYFASIGFPKTPIDPVLVATILAVTDALPPPWRDARIARTATLEGPVLVLARDRDRLEVRFTEHGAFTITAR